MAATGWRERAHFRTAKLSSLPSTAVGRKREREKEEGAEPGNTISEYELQRLERIKRNNAFMATLSLDSLSKVCIFESGRCVHISLL